MCVGFFFGAGGGLSFALLTTDHKNTKGSKDEMGGITATSGGAEHRGASRRGVGDGRNPGSSVWISFASGTGD